ncbi:MAG: hypothetical protein LUI61_08180 [Firmicutes bacterium]|nr:hypothetical protein [Bacillota bacterium]
MKKIKSVYIVVLIFSILASTILALLRDIALVNEFDTELRFYESDSFLPKAFGILTVWFIAAILIFCILEKKSMSIVRPSNEPAASLFLSSLISFVLAAFFGFNLFYGGDMGVIDTALLIFTLPAACYMIFRSFGALSENIKSLLGIAMVLWFFCLVLSVYFESGVAINNPNRKVELTYICFLMMYFVNECKYKIKNQNPERYIFFGFSSVIIGGLYSLPNVILLLFGRYPDSASIPTEIILFLLWIYVILHVCLFMRDIDEAVTEDEAESDF